jgi:hypothetical protein
LSQRQEEADETIQKKRKRTAADARSPGEAFKRVDATWNDQVLTGLEDNSCKHPHYKPHAELCWLLVYVSHVSYVSLTLCSFTAVHTYTDVKQFGEDGYGAKASKVLLAVRGKDFRHEKTKKKRGSYKGGTISLDSVSFKYDD